MKKYLQLDPKNVFPLSHLRKKKERQKLHKGENSKKLPKFDSGVVGAWRQHFRVDRIEIDAPAAFFVLLEMNIFKSKQKRSSVDL